MTNEKYLSSPRGLKCSGNTSEKIKTKIFFDVSVWMCVGNKRGPRDSIRLLIVTNAHESCFTTLINNLSVKHTIGQQMILFHRFLDWTDELFIDVLPLVQEKVGWGCWKRKKNKEISKQIIHNFVYTTDFSSKMFFFFNLDQLFFVNISWIWSSTCEMHKLYFASVAESHRL